MNSVFVSSMEAGLPQRTSGSVGVVDPSPAFRRWLVAALNQAGLKACEADGAEQLDPWLRQEGNRVVLATILGDGESVFVPIHRVRPDAVVVALIPDWSRTHYESALRGGAAGALPRSASPDLITQAVQAAIRNYALVPIPVLLSLSGAATERADPLALLTELEIGWLKKLAGGTTVAALADLVGYSEREMHRLLRRIYRKMEVTGRTAAMIKAAKCGVFD